MHEPASLGTKKPRQCKVTNVEFAKLDGASRRCNTWMKRRTALRLSLKSNMQHLRRKVTRLPVCKLIVFILRWVQALGGLMILL